MFIYEKKLEYPVKIKRCDPNLARLIITQLGGADGELGASQRYLNQRFAMPYKECKALLTDIGTGVLSVAQFCSPLCAMPAADASA